MNKTFNQTVGTLFECAENGTMNATDVVGYAQDGAAWCVRCNHHTPDPETVIFASDAGDLTCDECGERLDAWYVSVDVR